MNSDKRAPSELSTALDIWVHRLRLQRAVRWSVRGLDGGLALALALGAIGLLQMRLARPQFVLLVVALSALSSLLACIVAYAWPIRRLTAARRLDRILGLQERVSTALEFSEAQRAANPMLVQQAEDAVAAARQVNTGRALPVGVRSVEVLPALLLVLLLGLIWARGDAWFQAAARTAAVKQTVSQQQETIEKILAQVQNSHELTEAQKQALSEPLQQALQGLNKSSTPESSVSVLSAGAEQLQALSDPHAQQLSQALQQAGNQLAGQGGSPLQSIGQSLAQGDTVSAATQLKQLEIAKLGEGEKQQLAGQLQSMAQALASSNPALASQLQQAAQALQNGDTSAAQQALNNAAHSLAEAGQQITFSQTASQAQQSLQQGIGQVLAAGGGQQGVQAPSAGQGQSSSNQSGAANGQGASGSGHGQGQGSTGGEAPSSPIGQDNGPGTGGESTYEPIYAPSLLGGQNGQTVTLPGSGQQGNVIGQGPSTPGQQGQSLVPYQQVMGQYQQANQQAIDSGSIPFEFMQVIHDYFNSIKP